MAIKTFPLLLKASETTGHVPASLLPGEIAQNVADEKLFYRGSDGSVKAMPLGGAVGKQTVWVPADSFTPDQTAGPTPNVFQDASGEPVEPGLLFSASVKQYAFRTLYLPKSWDRGDVQAIPSWTHLTLPTSGNTGVVWEAGLYIRKIDETLTGVSGASSTCVDTGSDATAKLLYEAPTITISISVYTASRPYPDNHLCLQVARVPANGSDTMTVEAMLRGVWLTYTTNAATDD
jgi:hypothetical protein